MKIVNFTKKHLKSAVETYCKAFNRPPQNDNWSKKTATKRFEDLFNSAGYFGLAAIENNQIVGVMTGRIEQWYDKKEYYLAEFAVHPDFQNKKIGSKLLEELEKRLKKKTVQQIYLLATVKDKMPTAFYKKNDYNIDKTIVVLSKSI